MLSLEESKHFPPKFSYALKDLAEHFAVFAKPSQNRSPSVSSMSSNLSTSVLRPSEDKAASFRAGPAQPEYQKTKKPEAAAVVLGPESDYGTNNVVVLASASKAVRERLRQKHLIDENCEPGGQKITLRIPLKKRRPARGSNNVIININKSFTIRPPSLSPYKSSIGIYRSHSVMRPGEGRGGWETDEPYTCGAKRPSPQKLTTKCGPQKSPSRSAEYSLSPELKAKRVTHDMRSRYRPQAGRIREARNFANTPQGRPKPRDGGRRLTPIS